MKALLLGYYGSHNLGDDMMLACLLDGMQAQGARVTVVSEDPLETRIRFKVPAVQNTPLLGQWDFPRNWLQGHPFRLIRAIWNADVLVVGGGDLIRDDVGARSFLYTLEKILLAFLFGRPVYLANVGLPQPKTWYGRGSLRLILRCCRIAIVRDARSVELQKKYAPLGDCVHVPDVVLHLPEMIYGSRNSIPVFTPPSQSNTLVICLRGQANIYGRYALEEKHIQGLAACTDHWVEKHGVRVVFLPFQQGEEWGDNPLHRRVFAAMKRQDRAVVREWTGDFREVMDCIGSARCVLAMRLHAAVLALALRRPCALMPYDQKLDELGQRFGMQTAVHSADLENPDRLSAELDVFLNDADSQVVEIDGPSWDHSVFRHFLES